jgi:hypothetical protein
VQAEVCGGHPGDHERNAEPEEGDDEDGGDEPGARPGSGQRDQGAVDAQQRQPEPTPATAAPARKAAAMVVAIAAKVAATPASKTLTTAHRLLEPVRGQ